ncbi:hypothetical protein [Chryseolinea sp. H1M3-3]|uniref:trypsin-like serine peptidase n=1 Tax=Chryseolinea sp. H1M3-3 TaxID=3034144 RepID=UPI0023EBE6E0|nr:hypothetical protein [Chryseolinea sp. H1M3-3]
MIRIIVFVALLCGGHTAFTQNELACQPDPTKRVQILQKQLPNDYTCYMKLERGWWSINLGTGMLIHPRVILTAGHNTAFFLFSKSFPFVFSKVKKATLYMGSIAEEEYTIKKVVGLKKNRSSFFKKGYWANAKITRDFAVIILPDDSVYQSVKGHYQIAPVVSADLKLIHITGSPRDKDEHTMWTSETDNFQIENGFIRYDLYTEQRNSGSPIWIEEDKTYRVIGVHSRGYGDCNAGVLIDKVTFDEIQKWCKEAGISL